MRAYLDACIVLDYLLERNEASIDFIENFARKNGINARASH
jgi:hypothetical protein